MDLSQLTIVKTHQGLKNKEFSCFEITKAYLDIIKEKNQAINAFLTISEDLALKQAKEVDEKINEKISKGEEIDLLAGIPCAIKDNILIDGVRCTAGSKILENYNAPYDATVIKKLKEKDAIVLGKTNLDEFAMGSSTENSAFGPTRNPNDLNLVPGGSSGGSAAAVAADMSVFSLGSDTGGSIRLPAAFCGVVGLKPSYGAVSRYGLMAYASSLDQIGPIAKTVEDCQIVFNAIAGKDLLDSTSVESLIQDTKYNIQDTIIGVPKEYFSEGIDPEVEKVIKDSLKKCEDSGIKLEEISLPNAKYALPCYYIIAPSEAAANLSRYDGIKYGFSEKRVKDLAEVYFKSRGKGFGSEVRRRIMIGTYALSAGYYDAYYLRAQKVRALIKSDFDKAFEKVDAIFSPVSPFLPFKIGERIEDPLSMYLVDIYTVSVNLAGLPSLALPVGFSKGLPVGLQIIGRPFEEQKILVLGKFFEKL